MSALKRLQAATVALEEAVRAIETCRNAAIALQEAGEPLERSWLTSVFDYPSEFQRTRRCVLRCLDRAAVAVTRVRMHDVNCDAIRCAATLRVMSDRCGKCPSLNATGMESHPFVCEAYGRLAKGEIRVTLFNAGRLFSAR